MSSSRPDRDPDGAPSEVSTSELLVSLRDRDDVDQLTIGDVATAMEGRTAGVIFVLFGLPETIPMVGFSAILATPIFVAGLALAIRGDGAWVPGWVKRKTLAHHRLQRAIDRGLPLLRRLERVSRPRWPLLAGAHRLHGIVCMLLALVLAVPIPGLNILSAFGVVGTGVGIIQRDGLLIAIASAVSVVAVAGSVVVLTGLWAILAG
jgi:hypothetical protein